MRLTVASERQGAHGTESTFVSRRSAGLADVQAPVFRPRCWGQQAYLRTDGRPAGYGDLGYVVDIAPDRDNEQA